MSIVLCGICPHPPIAVPEVGYEESERVAATQSALTELGRRIKESGAETVVIISPHAPVFREVVAINRSPVLQGDLLLFRAGEVSISAPNDPELALAISEESSGMGLETVELNPDDEKRYGITLRLDHGVTVPMYFFQKGGVKLPLVHAAMTVAPLDKLYIFGQAVRRAADALNKKVALIASGDMSHGLTEDAPGGYLPRGAEFDRQLAELLAKSDFAGVLNMDRQLVESAGECGYRSIVMMLGALDGCSVQTDVLAYEGPFGVGYMTVSLKPLEFDNVPSIGAAFKQEETERIAARRAAESFLVRLARETLETYVKGERPAPAAEVPQEFRDKRAGVFVSIKKHGVLRGCIGTISPTASDIVGEVTNNAISAGTRDPRFQPVRESELADLEYSVDVLDPPEPIRSADALDPKKYGVVVRAGSRSGLLLPDLEGVDTVSEQVAIARQKAGIGLNEPVSLERFLVIRHT